MSQNNFNNTPHSHYFYFPISHSRSNANLGRELADIFFDFSSSDAVPVDDMEFEHQNEQDALDMLRLLSLVPHSQRSAAASIVPDQRDASSPVAAPIVSDQRDASSPVAAPIVTDQRDASILSEQQRQSEYYVSDMLRLLSLTLRNPRGYYQEPVQSRNILSRLPTSVVQEGAKPDTCNICLGDHETGEELMRLPCFHQFHTGCITRWIETKAACPSCRHPIASTES